MPDGETKEILGVNVQYLILVKNREGRSIRIETSGKMDDQVMFPYGYTLDTKIAEKEKELDQP